MHNQPTEKPAKTATITLDTANNDRKFPAYQLSINAMDGENSGHGYRLMGPKYLGRSKNLRTVDLDQRDADKIRGILDEVFPQTGKVDLARLQAALLKTTDGCDVPDDFEIPAAEVRRILSDLL
ncbi:MAG: hypothetical protein HOY75_08225 [Streptomyces sp.]|nr:hypothetical protein [Streptomyces sp.]